jgi:hypothetical protein
MMASGWTQRGITNILKHFLRTATTAYVKPTNLYVMLVTSAVAPTKTTTTFTALTEIAAGNGYTAGGTLLAYNATDWDVLTEADPALAQLKDIVWTASGGSIPSSGGGARYAVLTDDNATLGSREVYAFWDLVSDRTVSVTQTLTLQDLELSADMP